MYIASSKKETEDKKLSREWHQKYKKHCNEVRKVYIKNNPLRKLLWSARYRAKRDNIIFDITLDDLFIPVFCPYLGIKLRAGGDRAKGASPTVDRIIPDLGYVKENIQIISDKANRMKNNASPQELIMFAQYVLKTQPNG